MSTARYRWMGLAILVAGPVNAQTDRPPIDVAPPSVGASSTVLPGSAKGFAPDYIRQVRAEEPAVSPPVDVLPGDLPDLPGPPRRPMRMPVNAPSPVYAPPPGAIVTAPVGHDSSSFAMMLKFKPGDDHLLQIESQNGLMKFFVGGRLQIDATWFKANDTVQASTVRGGIGKVNDAVNFRRARFDLGGTFYKNIDFLMEFDFINTTNAERNGAPLPIDTPAPTDMHVTFKELPGIGNLRIGNMKNPISFEHLTSSRFLNFMERSLAFDAFVENQNNGFMPGVMAFDTALDERMTWSLGVFKNTRNIFGWNTGDGEFDLTGRVTALPIYEDDGAHLLHLGIGFSHRDMDDDQERLRTRLLLRNGPAVLHTIVAEARMAANHRFTAVPEIVAVVGPWSFATELYLNWVRDARSLLAGAQPTIVDKAFFHGGYIEALYFITGEHRAYNRKTGAFGRVVPRTNFTGFTSESCNECDVNGHGDGAWQVGVRYSWVDLDNQTIRGGSAHDLTLGLSWFLNPYLKWQWNITSLYRNAPNPSFDGWVHGFGTRIAFDF